MMNFLGALSSLFGRAGGIPAASPYGVQPLLQTGLGWQAPIPQAAPPAAAAPSAAAPQAGMPTPHQPNAAALQMGQSQATPQALAPAPAPMLQAYPSRSPVAQGLLGTNLFQGRM